MTTLNIYLSTTGGGKRDIMKAFGEGAELDGVKVKYIDTHTYEKSDYAEDWYEEYNNMKKVNIE